VNAPEDALIAKAAEVMSEHPDCTVIDWDDEGIQFACGEIVFRGTQGSARDFVEARAEHVARAVVSAVRADIEALVQARWHRALDDPTREPNGPIRDHIKQHNARIRATTPAPMPGPPNSGPQIVFQTATPDSIASQFRPCDQGRHRWAYLVSGDQACAYCGTRRPR
jgi:hypothetical protein